MTIYDKFTLVCNLVRLINLILSNVFCETLDFTSLNN